MAEIRELTRHLLECLALDTWPRMAAIVDFGIASPAHLGALQYARKAGRTPEEFDAALGSGPALNALCAVPVQPYAVNFDTDWDHMPDEEEDDGD